MEAITEHGVVVEIGGRRQMVDGMSSIVLATGSKAVNELAEELADEVKELYVVGDARQVARIVDATAQVADAALRI